MARKTVGELALSCESIAFQDGKFFDALTQDVIALREDKYELYDLNEKKFFRSKPVKQILNTIARYTNINLVMEEGGPATIPPILDTNHVFYRQQRKEIEDWKKYWYSELPFIEKAMKALDTKIVTGGVDLKNSKVSGVFSVMEMPLYMPAEMLIEDEFTPEEVAAIILHEVGHCFTFFEYVSRTVSTNQVLSTMIRAMDKSVSYEDRVVVLQKGAETLKLDREVQQQIKKCETVDQVTVVTVSAAAEQCVSELGFNIYDAASCEQLADNFAARHGAGVHVVIALDKLIKSYKYYNWFSMFVFFATVIITSISTMGLMVPVWILIFIFSPDKENDIYDNEFSRFDRVKRQLVEELKQTKSENRKQVLTRQIEDINTVLTRYSDTLGWMETLAYYVRPGYRAAHKVEQLQKDLERIASNDLFVAAAKLKSLAMA